MLSFKIIEFLVLEKILKVFTIYGHGGHLSHMTKTILQNLCSHFLRRPHIKFGFDWPSSLREKDTLKIMVIYMYIAPGQRQTRPWPQIFFKNMNVLLIWPFAASFTL